MTLSSHKSSYKAQNYFDFSTAGIDNSDTFTNTTEPLDFEAFYYTMLNSYKDTFLLGDPLGENKPLGAHVLMLYDRLDARIHHICIHMGKSEKDVKGLLPYMLKIISKMKPDYYVSFNTYSTLTHEAIKQ